MQDSSLYLVFAELEDPYSLLKASQVCKQWNTIAKSNTLWQNFLIEKTQNAKDDFIKKPSLRWPGGVHFQEHERNRNALGDMISKDDFDVVKLLDKREEKKLTYFFKKPVTNRLLISILLQHNHPKIPGIIDSYLLQKIIKFDPQFCFLILNNPLPHIIKHIDTFVLTDMVMANTAIIPSILNHSNQKIIDQIGLTLLIQMVEKDNSSYELIKNNKNPTIQSLIDLLDRWCNSQLIKL